MKITQKRQMEIYHLLQKLSEESHCIDKQVACIITTQNGKILSHGINTIVRCNKNCHDKENRICEVEHAEVNACKKIPQQYKWKKNLIAHVTLFPCQSCQTFVSCHCDTIVSYTGDHKGQIFENIVYLEDISAKLIEYNGVNKQLSVAQGEFAELITAISDFFYRREDKGMRIEELLDEILDAELMLQQIKRIAWKGYPETFNLLRTMRSKKYKNLLEKLASGKL